MTLVCLTGYFFLKIRSSIINLLMHWLNAVMSNTGTNHGCNEYVYYKFITKSKVRRIEWLLPTQYVIDIARFGVQMVFRSQQFQAAVIP